MKCTPKVRQIKLTFWGVFLCYINFLFSNHSTTFLYVSLKLLPTILVTCPETSLILQMLLHLQHKHFYTCNSCNLQCLRQLERNSFIIIATALSLSPLQINAFQYVCGLDLLLSSSLSIDLFKIPSAISISLSSLLGKFIIIPIIHASIKTFLFSLSSLLLH